MIPNDLNLQQYIYIYIYIYTYIYIYIHVYIYIYIYIYKRKKTAMMSMNSDKTYKCDKMEYQIMNIKVEVNMMKAVIIKQ